MKNKLLVLLIIALFLVGCTPPNYVLNNNHLLLDDNQFSGEYRSMVIDNNGNFLEYDGNVHIEVIWNDPDYNNQDILYVLDTSSGVFHTYKIKIFLYEFVQASNGDIVNIRNVLLEDVYSDDKLVAYYSVWDGYIILEVVFSHGKYQYLLVNTDTGNKLWSYWCVVQEQII